MSWGTTRRRFRLMHTVLDEVARTGRPVVPEGMRADVDAEFGDFGGFLREVQRRWQRSFDARLDGLLEAPPDDLVAAGRELWRELAADLPETRLLLDTYAAHPALAEGAQRHRTALVAVLGTDEDALRPAANTCPVSRWWRRASA
jgi:hypothetical protein